MALVNMDQQNIFINLKINKKLITVFVKIKKQFSKNVLLHLFIKLCFTGT